MDPEVGTPAIAMSDTAKGAMGSAARTLLTQLVLVLIVAAIWLALRGDAAAMAALYGGTVALVNAALLFWFWRRAEKTAGASVQHNMQLLYGSAVVRFMTVLTLFALGMGGLQLAPLPLLIAFIAGQAALAIRQI